MPIVIEYNHDANEMHVSCDERRVYLDDLIRGTRERSRAPAALTAKEARMLAESLMELADEVGEQEVRRAILRRK